MACCFQLREVKVTKLATHKISQDSRVYEYPILHFSLNSLLDITLICLSVRQKLLEKSFSTGEIVLILCTMFFVKCDLFFFGLMKK